jgi:threonine dehydrogenase-like Zn-dependent dehydrogenase
VRALSIDSPGHARLVDRATPAAGSGEVLLKVAFAGLCGTDLSAFLGKNPLIAYPRIIGHEISGTVVELGRGVDAAWKEATVAVSPYKNCGACPACRLGRPNACRNNETLGVQRDGALAEYAAVPVSRLVPSTTLPLDVLALVEPFSIGMHAVRRTEVTAADTVLVLGCGGVGAGAIAAASALGARVIGLDLDMQKLEQAVSLGARDVVDGRGDIAAQIHGLTDGDGPSVVIEAVGSPSTYRLALELVAPCGRIGCVGWLKGEVPLEARLIVLKEVAILGSRNATDELSAVVALFESGAVDPRALVTHRVALDAAPAMLAQWAHAPQAVGKILVAVDEQGRA